MRLSKQISQAVVRRSAGAICKSPLAVGLSTVQFRPLSTHSQQKGQSDHSGSAHIAFNLNSSLKYLTVFLAGMAMLTEKAENCGIVGVVGSDDASGFILEGLTILRNRGYDSAGLATIDKEGTDLEVTKYASRDTTADSIDLVRSDSAKHRGHFTGIGHTRWATHGGKTDFNAHPHTDQHHRIALIHNGTINNSHELKKELQAQGIKFLSETDTEVIAQLVGLNLDKGMNTKEAVAAALSR
jgi:glutamine---fructose-6-phosphate transaminase (isomerizing)